MKKIKAQGVVVPMVSPFTSDGKIDEPAARRLVEHVVDNGCHPFVLGTTGEALSIPLESRLAYVKAATESNAWRKTLYAGIAGMCMEDTILAGKMFADAGAEVLVAHLPSYYLLPAESMLRYFEELADALPRPLMLYNIPSTTHMSIPVEVVRTLSGHENIIGLKDSERDLERLDTLAAFAKETEGFYYLLGWAAQSIYALKSGADGIVPGTGNAFPELYYELYRTVQQGDFKWAEKYQKLTDDLGAVYQEGKLLSQALPGLKILLEDLGLCASHCIPPCYPLSREEGGRMIREMRKIMKKIPSFGNQIT